MHAAAHADDVDAEAVLDAGFDSCVDVAGVDSEEGAEHDDDFAGAVAGGVVEGGTGELEGVLEAGGAFGFF